VDYYNVATFAFGRRRGLGIDPYKNCKFFPARLVLRVEYQGPRWTKFHKDTGQSQLIHKFVLHIKPIAAILKRWRHNVELGGNLLSKWCTFLTPSEILGTDR